MTQEPEQLEAQSRAAIIANLNDPSVQIEYTDRGIENWNSLEVIGLFNLMHFHYRIAKPKKFYRVAKLTIGTTTADSETQEKAVESSSSFIEWIDDERKYYD